MLRQFDIASLYIYDNEDGTFDCIDGRQRIGAIMSFLGKNPDDDDNGFDLKVLNEIYTDEAPPFGDLQGVTYVEAKARAGAGDSIAKNLIDEFDHYKLTIVKLSASRRAEEFNLQFTRLNVGTIINSGEKLHAMVGEMRNVCFEDGGIGQHPFLEGVKIPTRRYSKEQVAAQIIAQVFAIKETGEFTRTRHFDLQKFFKEQATLDERRRGWVKEMVATLDALAGAFNDLGILRNRAITVSTVLLAWKLKVTKKTAEAYASFVEEFLCRLNWQIRKGLDVDDEYRYLMDFQRHVTQASVEKPAVQARAETLEAQHKLWETQKAFTGDKEYLARTRKKPGDECRSGS